MSSPNLSPLLLIPFFLSISTTSSSPLSTIAISHISNRTLVCALLPSLATPTEHDLNCTAFPGRKTRKYPSGAVPFSAIAAGNGFLCALTSSAATSVMHWWDFPRNRSLPDAKRVYVGPTVSALSAGDSHVCGITGDAGSFECWRWRHLSAPDGGFHSAGIAVGGDFVCSVNRTGGIRCFGDGAGPVGVVGNEPPGNYTAVAAGSSHACAVSTEDDLVCWGAGAPKVANNAVPIDSLALGDNRTCSLYVNGTVLCWGESVALPEDVAGSQFIALDARGDAFCGVLMVNYSLICWGSEVFDRSHVVFESVLPGTCSSVKDCSCGVVPGSGTMCSGNRAICRSTCGRNRNRNRLSISGQTQGSDNKRRFIFISVGSVGLCLTAICFLYFLFGYRKARPNVTMTTATNVSAVDRHVSRFFGNGAGSLLEEFPIKVLLRITEDFSDNYKVGSGSFGSVYRATLDDGRVVAIKRAELSPASVASTSRPTTGENRRQCRESAFVSELALLSRVNHRNLVRLLGYCKDLSELILVYEFMSGGTLRSLLHSPEQQADSRLGSWPARIRVALDSARGIEYLHAYAVPPIIHRDIKSSNILLDENWTAKVSDFGLSLMTTDDEWSGCTAGTVGYMDPEYYRLQHLTTKSDVYSFGVVLLEILSGSKVIQRYEGSGSPKNVVDVLVPHILADDVRFVLDKRLPFPTPSQMEAVAFMGYLAADCVSAEGRNRPTMTEVVNGLERALVACTPQQLSRSSTRDSS